MNQYNRIPLDQETIFTDFDCAEENARQAKLVSFPEGFHEILSPDGTRLGFGFYCSRCKLHFPGNAPKVVKHCGKESKFPELPDGLIKWLKFFFSLKQVKLEQHRLPRKIYFNI